MNQRSLFIYLSVILIVIILSFLVVIFGRRSAPKYQTITLGVTGLKAGQSAPNFSLSSINRSYSISLDTAGTKPLVLTFFASWCVPCRGELPTLEQFAKEYAGQIQVIGIDTGDTKSGGASLIGQTGITFPVAFDPTEKLAFSLYSIPGLPSTVMISPDKKIIGTQEGVLSNQLLNDWTNLLLKSADNTTIKSSK